MSLLIANFDQLVQSHWSEQDLENAKQVARFVQLIMNDHDFNAIRAEFGSSSYVQHNRSMAPGIDGVIESVGNLTKRFPDFQYDVKRIMVDGPLVTIHSHATLQKKQRGNDQQGLNIMDTWKVEDGKLVEHWDTLQPLNWFMRVYNLLTGGAIRNQNGVF